ncbi:MAG TPA: alpha/beta fold hydrolase [Kofleriaceae bacterium]|jgi:predicted alpha/beta hydrolase|nr:alpha/beta fold hydrolase [Kofleriaceae bacterium]
MPSPTQLTLIAADGHPLAADHYAPLGPLRAAAVIAPAMAVPRRLYRHLASYLASHGVAVVVPDYRGVAGSPAPRDRAVMVHDWADLDMPAALAELTARYPDAPRVWIGHSVGGQLLGLTRNPPVDRALLLASQSGHWRLWRGPARLGMAAFGHVVVPGLVALTGRLPMRLVGGEDVPAGAARQWARWIRDRRYMADFARTRPGGAAAGFDRFTGPLRAYAVADDGYAPRAGVDALVAEFTRARREVIAIAPADLGVRRLGHFGVVQPGAARLWPELLGFVVGDTRATEVAA